METIERLLLRGQSRWLLPGAALGALIGLLLLLAAVQLYVDFQRLMANDQSGGKHFIQVNKQVNIFNTLGVSAGFAADEIEEIRGEPFVRSVGVFESNEFRVSASSSMLGFYTELFFEALPAEYLDIDAGEFDWEEGDEELPIIMSRDYLALYNFGFAPSQGLPQFTPNTIRRVSFDIRITGKGQRRTFRGRIAGFSDRINSILVPLPFLQWANERYGSGERQPPSRLILEVDNPASEEVQAFVREKNLEMSTGRLIGGQFVTMLRLVTALLLFIGLLIFVLSILIFALNFQLMIAQANRQLRLLLELGYRRDTLADLLVRRLGRLFLSVGGLTLLALFLFHWLFASWMKGQGFELGRGLHWLVWILAIGLSAAFYLVNVGAIRRSVGKV